MTTPTNDAGAPQPAAPGTPALPVRAVDLDILLRKLKLLEFGLYGLQQYGRSAPMDAEDIGPFCRLAEEIESDLLELQRRLASMEAAGPRCGRVADADE